MISNVFCNSQMFLNSFIAWLLGSRRHVPSVCHPLTELRHTSFHDVSVFISDSHERAPASGAYVAPTMAPKGKATAKKKKKTKKSAGGGRARGSDQPPTEPADGAPALAEEPQVEAEWTSNEGELTDDGEEAPAATSSRAQVCLVTAACPRNYLRDPAQRKAQSKLIPEDFSKPEFLKAYRGVFNANSNRVVEKAACYDEPHKRLRRSLDRRERHIHVVQKASGNFAHKKVSDAFAAKYGLHLDFSFKQNRFVGYLRHMMVAGKKPSHDLDMCYAQNSEYDMPMRHVRSGATAHAPLCMSAGNWIMSIAHMQPATFPPNLNIQEELKAKLHPGEGQEDVSERKKTQAPELCGSLDPRP